MDKRLIRVKKNNYVRFQKYADSCGRGLIPTGLPRDLMLNRFQKKGQLKAW